MTDEGDAFVGYWARLSFGPFTLPYAAILYKPARQATEERAVIRSSAAPALQNGELRWDVPRLGVTGRWTSRIPGYRRTLLESPGGSIVWDCHVPCAEARIDLAGRGRLSGLGYVEHLTMSVKPWRLPFDELRWGRFLSADDAVIWTEWRGREPRQWVFHNEQEVTNATIGVERVEWPTESAILELRSAVPIREGPLASTALRAVPGARLWLRRGIEHAHEVKWLAAGTLSTKARLSSGWAIHEIVRLR